MTASSPRRQLFNLAWPTTIAMAVRSLYRINDQYFVQDLGVAAQSAAAVGSMVAIWFFAFGEMVHVGNLAITGRRLGEGDHDRAAATNRSALRLAICTGIVLALLTLLGRTPLAELLIPGEGNGIERAHLIDYLTWIGLGQVVMLSMPVIDSSFMARHNSRVPLALELLAVACNATLNWLLVPIYGVGGAGLATALSRIPSLLLGLWLLNQSGVRQLWTGPAPFAVARRVFEVGIPTGLAIMLYSAIYQAMLALTFPHFGAAGRSALGPGFGIESVFFCAYWGVGVAVASLVARSLGEGKPERARAIAKLSLKVNLLFGLGSSLSFLLFGPALIRLLADDPEAIAANIEYLGYMAWAQPFQSVGVIFEEVLIGAGLTKPVLLSTGVMNLIRIPLAHIFAVGLGFGLPGIWWAINLSSIGKSIWSALLYRQGRWEHHDL